jgi:hypothetical protein
VGRRRPGPRRAERRRGALDERGAPRARHEHARTHEYAHPGELRPPDHVLERLPALSPRDHPLETVGVGRRLDEQGRLVLGEDAAGRAQSRDEGLRGVDAGQSTLPP